MFLSELPRDIIRLIFTFTAILDVINTTILNSKTIWFRSIRTNIRERVFNVLHDCGLDPVVFFAHVCQDRGYISGSFLLELIMGSDQFVSSDIDVYIVAKDRDFFSPLHQYLFERSTGLTSAKGKMLSQEETKRISNIVTGGGKWGLGGGGVDETKQEVFESHYPGLDNPVRWFQKHTYRITSVYNYHMRNGRIIQVISLTLNRYPNAEIEHFWDYPQHFDFRICQSQYDGQKFRLPHIEDVRLKQLTFTDSFRKQVQLYSPSKRLNHEARVVKYIRRGFHLTQSIQYSKLYDVIEHQEPFPVIDPRDESIFHSSTTRPVAEEEWGSLLLKRDRNDDEDDEPGAKRFKP